MKLLLTLIALTVGSSALADHKLRNPSPNPKRTAVIYGPIGRNNLAAVEAAMEKWAADGSGEAIDLIINSPGGAVTTGFLFINRLRAIQAKGVKVRCFVPDVAASMAFQIFMHCNERYVLERSFLLWHRVRVFFGGFGGTVMTAPELSYLGWVLQQLDNLILQELDATVGQDLSKEEVRFHFEKETLHTGIDLQTLAPNTVSAHHSIRNLYDLLNSEKVPRTLEDSPFGSTDQIPQQGTIYYISPKVSSQFGIDLPMDTPSIGGN